MKQVEYSNWYLPPPAWKPKGKPYPSSWKMNAREAAELGALGPVPGTTEVKDMPETEEEIRTAQFSHPTAGFGGALVSGKR